ncbi:MAG TPA: family membership [Thermoanaerobaculia bacterium]|nr:family membership [Thermoanaerobaculia bacterium]
MLAVSGVVVVGALLGSLWLERRSELTLPTPTGSFAVGRAIYDWKDDAGVDRLAPVPGTKRELLVWIWYPSAPGPSAAIDDYVPAWMRTARTGRAPRAGRAAGAARAAAGPPGGLLGFLTRDLSKVRGHSARDADVSPRPRTFPVVVMRAGASAFVVSYSTLAEDLASHGYVVVGFDAPYRTFAVAFPDGRVMSRPPENNPELCEDQPPARQAPCVSRFLTAWTADVAFVLNRLERLNASRSGGKLAGRLDMTRVGVFGHSFGGATALQFCHDDPRCKAGIDIDGQPFGNVIQDGLRQPFMFLLSDHGDLPEGRPGGGSGPSASPWARHPSPPSPPSQASPKGRQRDLSHDSVDLQIWANIQSIYDRLPPDGRLCIAIRGANHFLFSDDGALLKSHIVLRALRIAGVVGIDGRRQLAVTAHCVQSFFDTYLKAAGVGPLELRSPLYPEIRTLR